MREYSRKSGPTILPGVLPKRLFLYTGSDLDMIYNLDILLPLDTLGVLPVLLFFGFWEYSWKAYFWSVEVLVIYVILLPEGRFRSSGSTLNTFIFGLV